VKQEERALGSFAAVLVVQLGDATRRLLQDRLIPRQSLRIGVGEIGQQAELHLGVAVGEEAHFQRLDQRGYRFRAADHRRYDDESAGLLRNAFREVHARQRMWLDQHAGHAIDQRDRKLTGARTRRTGSASPIASHARLGNEPGTPPVPQPQP